MTKSNSCFPVLFLGLLCFFPVTVSEAQTVIADPITEEVTQSDVEFNIYFLASDEFRGRDTGTRELKIASRYLATWFQVYGIQPAPGHDSYYQEVPFQRLSPPDMATLTVADSTYSLNNHLIAMNSVRGEFSHPIITLNYASREEIAEHDIEGKIVIAETGLPGLTSPQQFFSASAEKRELVAAAGGAGLIELYTNLQFPWQLLVNFLGTERIAPDDRVDEEQENIPHLWMNAVQNSVQSYLTRHDNTLAGLILSGGEPVTFTSRNVIGVVEGTDSELKDEYLLLSAHYDHVGVVRGQEEPLTGEQIFNGARDNAVGTAGVLAAAKFLAENPPRRSVIFAAWTAEERGLLGSSYFAEHPMVPLEQIVYNLNIDGAGYNDTTKVTVIGLGRTDADPEMKYAAELYELEAIPDPVPEQNLFDRSDNVNFARQGIPAPTYSMGLTAFDDEINYYYHQVTDEPNTLNYDYVTRYIRSFIHAAQSIANRDEAPFWLPGDVYEEAGIELYNRQ
jgi:hypothetical protein